MEKPEKPNYYQLLNVGPEAKTEDIIGSFLEISRRFSIFPYASNTEIRRIDKRFIEYKEAYQILTTIEERIKYDLEIGFDNHPWLEPEKKLKNVMWPLPEINIQEKPAIHNIKPELKDTLIRLTYSKHSLDHNDIEEFKVEKAKRKFKKARNFIRQEKYHEAINLLRELINQGFNDANYHAYLGFALMKKGWSSYAQGEFKVALEMDPENLIARKFFIDKTTRNLNLPIEATENIDLSNKSPKEPPGNTNKMVDRLKSFFKQRKISDY